LLLTHPELMQRPVVVRGDRAVIARPSDRVTEVLGSAASSRSPRIRMPARPVPGG
jgi:hypothetical protein